MKTSIGLSLIVISIAFFSHLAQARCCSDGGPPCYPKCFVETNDVLVEVSDLKELSLESSREPKIEKRCSRNPKADTGVCCVYVDGHLRYCM